MKKHLLLTALTCVGTLHAASQDWLVEKITDTTQVTTLPDGCLSIANGLVRRTFTLQPNVACVSLDELITRTLHVDLYYTGLQKNAYVSCQDGKARKMKLDSRGRLMLEVEVPAKSQTWFTFTGNK